MVRWVGAGGVTRPRPLRTVRESFPSHGSNLSKASPFQAPDPRLDGMRCLIQRIVVPTCYLAIPGCGLHRRAPVGSGFGCTKRRESLVYCNSQVEVVPHTFLAFPGQTDVGISGSLQAGFGFFGHPKAAPAARPYGSGDHDQRGPGQQLFHVLHSTPEDLGPLCTPAVLRVRAGMTLNTRTRLHTLLVQASQLSFGLLRVTVLASVHFVLTMSPNSNSTPD